MEGKERTGASCYSQVSASPIQFLRCPCAARFLWEGGRLLRAIRTAAYHSSPLIPRFPLSRRSQQFRQSLWVAQQQQTQTEIISGYLQRHAESHQEAQLLPAPTSSSTGNRSAHPTAPSSARPAAAPHVSALMSL